MKIINKTSICNFVDENGKSSPIISDVRIGNIISLKNDFVCKRFISGAMHPLIKNTNGKVLKINCDVKNEYYVGEEKVTIQLDLLVEIGKNGVKYYIPSPFCRLIKPDTWNKFLAR